MKRIFTNIRSNKSLLVLGNLVLSVLLYSNSALAHRGGVDSGYLTISGGATLVVSNGIQLVGNRINYTNNGTTTYDASTQVVLADGGTINGINSIPNLEIQGDYKVGVTSADSLYITGILKKTSGTLTTYGKLTLVSTAAASAMIDDEGGALNGNAYIQHYAGGSFGFHHFSSPISDGTVSSWANLRTRWYTRLVEPKRVFTGI